MKIGFYGHSTSCWAEFPIYNQNSFIDKVIENYNATLVNKGVPQGSEERILFDLKKTKNLDIAIVFHSIPKFVYLPTCSRDVAITDIDRFKAFYLWRESNSNSTELAKAKQEYFSYGGIKESFEDIETFLQTFSLYKEYLYHPDLQLNRYHGAMLQIDQYLLAKRIPVLHVALEKRVPSWFTFSSGKNCPHIQELADKHYEIGLPNNVSAEGQQVVANMLIKEIDELVGDAGL